MKKDFDIELDQLSTEEIQNLIHNKEGLSSEQFLKLKRELKLRRTVDQMMINSKKRRKHQNKVNNKNPKKLNKLAMFSTLNRHYISIFSIPIIALTFSYLLDYRFPISTNDDVKYGYSTIGKIKRIKENTIWTQDFNGGKQVTTSYTIYYTYTIKNNVYENNYFIVNKTTNLKYIRFFKENIGKMNTSIKYNSYDPAESTLIIPNLE